MMVAHSNGEEEDDEKVGDYDPAAGRARLRCWLDDDGWSVVVRSTTSKEAAEADGGSARSAAVRISTRHAPEESKYHE